MAKAKKNTLGVPRPNEDWEVEDALRTLLRAKEIKTDDALMAKVRKLMAFKLQEMKKVGADLDVPV